MIVVRTAVDAQRVLDRLRKGEDFAVLAHTESVDPNAEDYGYVGKVDLSTLRPELGEAIRGKSPGEVTEPVKVPGGYAILKVLPPSEGSVGQGMGASRDASSKAKYDIPPMLQGK